jgi:hypothetical protein
MKKPSKQTLLISFDIAFKISLIIAVLYVGKTMSTLDTALYDVSEKVEYTNRQLGSSGTIATQLAIGGDQIASEISKLKTTISYK